MIYVKVHKGVIAICDSNLIGKTFKQGKLCLKVSEHFYKDVRKDKGEVKKIMEEGTNLNIVGKESIRIALGLGILKKENIIEIEGVPHAQIFSC